MTIRKACRTGVWTQCDLQLSDFSGSKFCPWMTVDEKSTEDHKVLAG